MLTVIREIFVQNFIGIAFAEDQHIKQMTFPDHKTPSTL